MMSYWIWSNQRGGWWRANKQGYTTQLHEAGRYTEPIAREIVAQCNLTVESTDWPNEVMIPVVNDYLHEVGRRIMEEFVDGRKAD